jgi:hypothetical protein
MKKSLILLFVFILSACNQDSALQKSIISVLKDPDSAKFGKVEHFKSYACYEVNAKNAMGGYTGTQVAFMKKIDGSWHVVRFEKTTTADCLNRFKTIEEKEIIANNKDSTKIESDNIPARCKGNPDLKACLEFEKKYSSEKTNNSETNSPQKTNKVLDLFR